MNSRQNGESARSEQRDERTPSVDTARGNSQIALTALGTTADLVAIVVLFATGFVGLGTGAVLINVWVAAFFAHRGRLSAGRWLVTIAALLLTAALGGILGYLWGPALAPTASRDADLQGYCAALGANGFSVRDPEAPRSPDGRFFCKGIPKPINMMSACRWKWGPQKQPPTLSDESNAYTWRCHPQYR